MDSKRIKEFQKGDTVQGFYLIREAELKTAVNNNRYMSFVLADQTGMIDAKLWEYNEGDEYQYIENNLVKVRGQVVEWQGRLQLRIERIRLAEQSDNLNLEDFVPVAPYKPEEMLGTILKYVIKISNKDIKEIVSRALNEKREKLMYYPAAMKNHHSIRSGLLYHIMTMLKMAESITNIYTHLNKDLVYAGVIIHDLCKLDEMEASPLGMVSGYTMEGMLLGHIIQGIKMVERIGMEVNADREVVILLQHMILCHHYEPEFGSPKRPMIPEGELLHYLDIIDARMYDMRKALDSTETGQFSPKIWMLHNRKLYKAPDNTRNMQKNVEMNQQK